MFRRIIVGTALVLSLVVVPSALAAGHHSSKHYYLALGDSLSVGFQPLGGSGIETKQGYTNDLLAHYGKKVKHLKLVEVGCPGDTTTSLLTGTGNAVAATLYHCDRSHGSQLAAAVHFLKAHHKRGEVPLLTIDIGANDVVSCGSEPTFEQVLVCVSAGEQSIKTNTPKILAALHKAAPKGTRLVAMNLYDPLLADELSSNSSLQALGTDSLALIPGVNGSVAKADSQAHFKTADVAKAFGTYDTTPISYDGGPVPANVVKICQFTWMCTSPPIGPNIHANATGYQVIAKAFEKVIGKLK